MTDWNYLDKYLRPYTLRQVREDLRNQLDDDNKQELDPFIDEITEMLVDLDGDQIDKDREAIKDIPIDI